VLTAAKDEIDSYVIALDTEIREICSDLGSELLSSSSSTKKKVATKEFLLKDHSQDSIWPLFLDKQTIFTPVHQQTILSNDSGLQAVYDELVPAEISSDEFWLRWRYHVFLLSHKPNAEEGRVSTEFLSIHSNKDKEQVDGWDEWD